MDYSTSSRLSLEITLVSSFLLTLPLPKSSLPSSITNDSLPYDCPLGTVTPNCVRTFLTLTTVTSLSFFALRKNKAVIDAKVSEI